MNPFETGLDKNPANYEALSPLSFLSRTANVFPDRVALIHGEQRVSWREAFERCRRLASALETLGVGPGETVAAMLPNTPPMWEAHMGVPAMGAVLNPLNVRLDAETIAFILEHGGAKALITDRAFSEIIGQALSKLARKPHLIEVDDPLGEGGDLLGGLDYEAFLGSGDPDGHVEHVARESGPKVDDSPRDAGK